MSKSRKLKIIRSTKLCLMAHPDNTEGSEFEDRITDLEEIEKEIMKEPNDEHKEKAEEDPKPKSALGLLHITKTIKEETK